MAMRCPMRCVCARRRAAGLVGVWRSMARLLNQVTGSEHAAVVIYCLSATNGIDVTGLADGQVYLRIMGRDSGSVATLGELPTITNRGEPSQRESLVAMARVPPGLGGCAYIDATPSSQLDSS